MVDYFLAEIGLAYYIKSCGRPNRLGIIKDQNLQPTEDSYPLAPKRLTNVPGPATEPDCPTSKIQYASEWDF
jgi:hypothetical protein